MRQPGGGGLAALLLVQLARAQITTTYVADLVCTRDEVYSSLSREGREFCESVLGDSCESVSKPGSYSSLADEEISSYVSLTPNLLATFPMEADHGGMIVRVCPYGVSYVDSGGLGRGQRDQRLVSFCDWVFP